MNHAFYELKHEIGAEYFTVERNQNFLFPLHMHRCFEIILLLEGSMTVTVEKKVYVLNAGDMIFVKPSLVHSLKTSETSRHMLCIFAPELIAAISHELIRFLLTSTLILIYDALIPGSPSISGILNEAIAITSSIIGIIRFRQTPPKQQ